MAVRSSASRSVASATWSAAAAGSGWKMGSFASRIARWSRRKASMRRLRAMRKIQVATEAWRRSKVAALRQTATITSWLTSSDSALARPRRSR